LLKDKRDVCSVFQTFHRMIHTEFNTFIKNCLFDNGGEYMSSDLSTYFVNMTLSIKPVVSVLLGRTEAAKSSSRGNPVLST
jgi:hypothetical protein